MKKFLFLFLVLFPFLAISQSNIVVNRLLSFYNKTQEPVTLSTYYVSTTGTDTSSTGSLLNPFSIAKADSFWNFEEGDQVLFLPGVYKKSFTANNLGVKFSAYNRKSQPLIFGADTLTGFTFVEGSAGATVIDTFKSATALDDIWRCYSRATYDYDYFNFGNYDGSSSGSAVRFRNLTERANVDSGVIELTVTGATTWTVYSRVGAENTSTPNLFAAGNLDSNKTTGYDYRALNLKDSSSFTFSGSFADGDKVRLNVTGSVTGLYSSFVYDGDDNMCFFFKDLSSATGNFISFSSYNHATESRRPKLLVYSKEPSSNSFYKKVVLDSVYMVFFSDTLGTQVSDASLIDGPQKWCYRNDTLYVGNTLSVIATTRNGIEISAGVTIEGFDIRNCNRAIKVTSTVDSFSVIGCNVYKNLYGVEDTLQGISLYGYSKFNNNFINFWVENKDTVYFYNNVNFSFLPNTVGETVFYSEDSKLILANNIFAIDNFGDTKVGEIDFDSNIVSMNRNLYIYDFITDGENLDQFWEINSVEYDSLSQVQTLFGVDLESMEIKSWHASPINSSSLVWNNNGSPYTGFSFGNNEVIFKPRFDTLVSSPLVNAGINLGYSSDFDADPIAGLPEIGPEEAIVDVIPSGLFALMYNTSDSCLIGWGYSNGSEDLISHVILESTNITDDEVEYDSLSPTSYVYVHPEQSTVTSAPTIPYLNPIVSDTSKSTVSLLFYVKPGNLSSTFKVRYGIGSFSDSVSIPGSENIYIPKSYSYRVNIFDLSGNNRWSNSSQLSVTDSLPVTFLLTGLSQDTTYTVDISGINSIGWNSSPDKTFKIVGPGIIPADIYVHPDSSVKTIAAVNSLTGVSKIVAFSGEHVFADEVLQPKEGWTYKSFGSGLATIGDSTIDLSTNPSNSTIDVTVSNVTLDSLKIYGYKNALYGISFSADNLRIRYCEISGGENAHDGSTIGIRQISASTSGLRIQYNKIHNWGRGCIGWARPYESDISNNEMYWFWVDGGYYDYGGSGIVRLDYSNGQSPPAFHDCNYTVKISHNDVHHFDYAANFGGYSRLIIEYNVIHHNLDGRIFHGGVKHGAAGKIWDNNFSYPSYITNIACINGLIIRYNYIHHLQYKSLRNYTYGYVPFEDKPTATEPIILDTDNGLGAPAYIGSDGDYMRYASGAIYTFPPEPLMTGAGHNNSWIHNNLFYSNDKAIVHFGTNTSNLSVRNDGLDQNDLKPTYFINNTIYNCGASEYSSNANYYVAPIYAANEKTSPTKLYNNIIRDNSVNGAGVMLLTKYSSADNNIFFHRSGTLIDDYAPDYGTYAFEIRGRALSGGVPNGSFTGNQYNVDSSDVFNSFTDSIFVDSLGPYGTWIPDFRIVSDGAADDNGFPYSSIGDNYTISEINSTYQYWTQTHQTGYDGTGRSFAFDITGNFRENNIIGCLGVVGSSGNSPSSPTSLTVDAELDGIDLSWEASSPNISYFVVFKNGARYDSVSYPALSWTDPDQLDGITNYYKLTAKNEFGESSFSNEVSAMRYSSNTYYFANDGDDFNSGTHPNYPFETCHKSNNLTNTYTNKFKGGDIFNDEIITMRDNVTYTSYGEGRYTLQPLILTTHDFTVYAEGTQDAKLENAEVIGRLGVNVKSSSNLKFNNIWGHYYDNEDEDYMTTNGIGWFYGDYSNLYIQITNSIFEGGVPTTGSANDMFNFVNSDWILFDNVVLKNTVHALVGVAGATHVVFRNVRAYNQMHHIMDSYASSASDFLIEYCLFEQAGTGVVGSDNPINSNNGETGASYQGSLSNSIIRSVVFKRGGVRREILNNAGNVRFVPPFFNNRVYNCVFDNPYSTFALRMTFSSGDQFLYDNTIFNCSFTRSGDPTWEAHYPGHHADSAAFITWDESITFSPLNNLFEFCYFGSSGNNIYNLSGGGLYSTNTSSINGFLFQNNISSYYSRSVFQDPDDSLETFVFWNTENEIGSLYEGMLLKYGGKVPLVDAGRPHTFVNGSQSGTSLVVDDSRVFFNGWGWLDGDSIQVGSTKTKIIGSNHNTKTLTLSSSVSANDNTPVYLINRNTYVAFKNSEINIGIE